MTRYRIVPETATKGMEEAGHTAVYDCYSSEPGEGFDENPGPAAYDAMLSAAPDPVEDEELVEMVARAIAENGFGRPWDDFLNCHALDTDKSDLRDYARAVLALFGKG